MLNSNHKMSRLEQLNVDVSENLLESKMPFTLRLVFRGTLSWRSKII